MLLTSARTGKAQSIRQHTHSHFSRVGSDGLAGIGSGQTGELLAAAASPVAGYGDPPYEGLFGPIPR